MVEPRREGVERVMLRTFAPFAGGLAAALLAVLAGVGTGKPVHAGQRSFPRPVILHAIRMVESGDRDDVADGDNGAAIGPYQIHRDYWQDAVHFQPELGGTYDDCRRRAYAESVIGAYMQHYVPEAWAGNDAEVIARTHNGGPLGSTRAATLGYWQRVAARLGT
jgi:hypothetical protein